VEVFTDGYAYDQVTNWLHLISLVGNDSAVKAVSAAMIAHREITIHRDDASALELTACPYSKYRILSAKLDCGAVHQIVADDRFFRHDGPGSQLLVIPPDDDLATAVYQQVVSRIASPVIPEWAGWICSRLKQDEHLAELKGTVRAVEVDVDEPTLDKIISHGVAEGEISFDHTGGHDA